MYSGLMSLAILSTIFTCFFWGMGLLFSGYKRKSPQVYVFILFMIATFVYTMVFAKFHNYFGYYANFYPLQAFFVLSFFPLFYLYVHTLTMPDKVFNKVYLLHFLIPGLVFFIVIIVHKVWMTS